VNEQLIDRDLALSLPCGIGESLLWGCWLAGLVTSIHLSIAEASNSLSAVCLLRKSLHQAEQIRMQYVACCNSKVVATEMWTHIEVGDCTICTNADHGLHPTALIPIMFATKARFAIMHRKETGQDTESHLAMQRSACLSNVLFVAVAAARYSPGKLSTLVSASLS